MNFSRLSTSVLWLLPLTMLVVIASSSGAGDWLDDSPFFSVTPSCYQHEMPPSTFCHNQGTATQVSIGGEKASQFCCPWAWFSNWSGILSGRIRS